MKTILFFITLLPVFFCNVAFSQNSNYDLYRVNQFQAQSSKEYWTEERMANSIPIPFPEVSELPEQSQQKYNKSSKTEAETETFLPSSEHDSHETEAEKDIETFLPSSEHGSQESVIATRANMNLEPYKQAGKLYFRRDGVNYNCSAQFVGADNIILTAAHCIKKSNDSWSTNVVFRRGFENGGGQMTSVNCYGVNDGWNNLEDELRRKWDYAFGKTLQRSTVGYLGLSTVLPNSFKAIGYPANFEEGKYLYEFNGARWSFSDAIVQMQGNQLGRGASGGAWFQRHSNTVVGLNSFYRQRMWSPNFDFQTISLYEFIVEAC